jgi:serine/threonine protein kinase
VSSTPPPGALVEGSTLAGKYRIGTMLGQGGMCLVYEAEHIHLRQAVALKLLKPELARNATAVARFVQEAQAAATLRSPNVARVYDVDALSDGRPFISMELLIGHDLRTELQRGYALRLDYAADIVRQAANGIDEAHALGIVHRDLKPENLFLSDLGELTDRKLLKILDFGIAKDVRDGARQLTAPDTVFGTVDYMSPEQIRSASSVDQRADLWALGIILYELLTGRPPFSGDARAVIAQIVTDAVRTPSDIVPGLPPGLVEIVMKALAKSPADRFQSAAELSAALGPFCANIEPIGNVLARLPHSTMPRRIVGAKGRSVDPSRDIRTVVAFETNPGESGWAKRAIAVPAFAALGALLGLAVWQRDALFTREAPPSAQPANAAPNNVAPPVPVTVIPPPAPSAVLTATPIPASDPPQAPQEFVQTAPPEPVPAATSPKSKTLPVRTPTVPSIRASAPPVSPSAPAAPATPVHSPALPKRL